MSEPSRSPSHASLGERERASGSTASSARPTAVVFDLGNVLIRWDPHPAVAAGVGEHEAARFLAADDFDFGAWNHQQDAGRTWDEAEDDLRRTHPHWSEHAAAYRANFEHSLRGPLEDNVAVLEDLHRAGVPVFALTNWSAELFPVALERFGFLGLFDDIVVSGAEQVAKPDAAVFEVLRQRVGRPLDECVFIDDSPRNAAAAEQAGLDAVLYREGDSLREALRTRGLPV
jgi:2-haloacid dehalogenase